MAIMARVVVNHPHTAHAGLQNSLQKYWAFVQRVTLDIGAAFQPIGDDLRNVFLPDLFKGVISQIPLCSTCCPRSDWSAATECPVTTQAPYSGIWRYE